MKTCRIGCALWSLGIPDTVQSLDLAAELGFESIQFAFCHGSDLEPTGLDRVARTLERTGLEVAAGMVAFPGEDYTSIDSIRRTGGFVGAETFPERLAHCRAVGEALARLGIMHVTTHAGFIPDPGEPTYREALGRVADAVDALHEPGLTVGLETGQETAEVLLRVLEDLGCDYVGVNFDPGNFVLYGSADPVAAAEALGPTVTLFHAKDAVASERPGQTWGTEVPLGRGVVDFPKVLAALAAAGFEGPLIIEREGGTDRAADLAAALRWLSRLVTRVL